MQQVAGDDPLHECDPAVHDALDPAHDVLYFTPLIIIIMKEQKKKIIKSIIF